MTVIEAFSLGKPVIATDIGFMHEAISAVGMNTVFPMKDYNALRHKVIELWNDPDLCSQYGKIARNEYGRRSVAGFTSNRTSAGKARCFSALASFVNGVKWACIGSLFISLTCGFCHGSLSARASVQSSEERRKV